MHMTTDFISCFMWWALVFSLLFQGGPSLSLPAVLVRGKRAKKRRGRWVGAGWGSLSWRWLIVSLVSSSHFPHGKRETSRPTQSEGGGGILWGQQCLQNIWTVARSGGSRYFWTETAEEIFSAHCSANETFNVSGCGRLRRVKNKHSTHLVWSGTFQIRTQQILAGNQKEFNTFIS